MGNRLRRLLMAVRDIVCSCLKWRLYAGRRNRSRVRGTGMVIKAPALASPTGTCPGQEEMRTDFMGPESNFSQGQGVNAGKIVSANETAMLSVESPEMPDFTETGDLEPEVQEPGTLEARELSRSDGSGPVLETVESGVQSASLCTSDSVRTEEWVQGSQADPQTVDGRLVLDKAPGTFLQTPFIAKQVGRKQHDIAADIAQVGDLLVLAASFRGAMHYAASSVRQDSFAIGAEEGQNGIRWAIAVVADGVSEASQAHMLAEFLTQQTVVFVKEALQEKSIDSISDVDWGEMAARLVQASQDCCQRLAHNRTSSPNQCLSKWASTLEFAVVESSASREKPFVSVTVSGDGAVYAVSREKGWKTIKAGKARGGSIASNAVTALPVDPGKPIISFGSLDPGESLFIVTDGLGDMIGNGSSTLGGFFQDKFQQCSNIIQYLQMMDVSMYQADDDRTGILIKENQI